ncbi:GNAT family N-acetyltransferase [Cohnella yongneupensis]|uniref:GNAT family N-acetyltransferase n=1 Tax=Cohnella yongneupensis TaxID=425006 RepID=A0ABW0QVA8_9BACL
MADVRMLTKSEMKEAISLADATFRDAEQPSMAGAFPFIFSDCSMQVSFAAFENGQLVSFMGLVPWIVRIGDARLRVFSLGSVCTHPDARGRGTATEVLRAVYDYIRRAGASLLLVSGYRKLYTRSGCAPFGRVRRYAWDEEAANRVLSVEGGPSSRMREMEHADLFALYEIASARCVRYDLGVNELATLLKAEALASCMKVKHRIMVFEEEGIVKAFAVFGVAADFSRRGVVLEYGGDPDKVMRLVGQAIRSFPVAGVDFPVPWYETELQDQLALAGLPYSEEDHLGTINIVDGNALMEQLRPWLESRDSEASSALNIVRLEDGAWQLQAGDQRIRLTADELIKFVFDCSSAEVKEPEVPIRLKTLFPVPFPYTAGLAYV